MPRTLVAFPTEDSYDDTYYPVAGYDGEEFAAPNLTVRPISFLAYRRRIRSLNEMAEWLGGGLGYRLIKAFTQETTRDPEITGAKREGSAVINAWERSLTHPLGQQWNSKCNSFINRYTFEASSDISEGVMHSCQVARIVRDVLDGQRERVAAFLGNVNGPPTYDTNWVEFSRCIGNGVACPQNRWTSVNTPLCTEWSSAMGLGNVSIQGRLWATVRRSDRSVVRLQFHAWILDLYDFSINGNIARLAAPVQAGFPTLGLAGRTFQVMVELELDSSSYDFYPEQWSRASYIF